MTQHVKHFPGGVILSAEFIGGILDLEYALQNPVRAPSLSATGGPKKIKHASGPGLPRGCGNERDHRRSRGEPCERSRPAAQARCADYGSSRAGHFRPRKRGEALYYGDHEIKLVAVPLRDPDTVEILDADGRPSREALA